MTRAEIDAAVAALAIEDLNYASSSERLGIYRLKPPTKWKRGPLVNLLAYLGRWLLAARAALRGPAWQDLKGTQALAVVWSANQLQSLAPVLSRLPRSGILALHRSVAGPRFPDFAAFAASIPYLPRLLRLRAQAQGYRRLGFEYDLDKYLLTYGYFVTALRVLEHLAPRFVLVANDHTMQTRVFAHAASQLAVPTAYMQHASVTSNFPPLAFDLAFLDGLDAAQKYDQPGSSACRAFLTGIPKADAARGRARDRDTLQRVGVCVNVLDPVDRVVGFIASLRAEAPHLTVILRPHPSDERPWGAAMPETEFSDAKAEPSFAFLDKVDAVITGPSNIVLEAALVGVRSVYVDFGGLGIDHYGFLARGLCQRADSAAEALALLHPARESPAFAGALRAYCATVGTSYDGRSAELVEELLSEESAGGIDLRRWRRVPGFKHLEVHELAE